MVKDRAKERGGSVIDGPQQLRQPPVDAGHDVGRHDLAEEAIEPSLSARHGGRNA